jgi:hypothetical protein
MCPGQLHVVSGRGGGLFEDHFEEGFGIGGITGKIGAEFIRVTVVGGKWKVMGRAVSSGLADILMDSNNTH